MNGRRIFEAMRKPLVIVLILSIFIMEGCKKYSDGPFFSAWPRKERVANKWKIVSVEFNGKDSSSLFKDHIIEYSPKGTAIYQKGTKKYFGTWQLNNMAADIDVDYDSLGRHSFLILRLKEKELWYRDKRTNWTYKLQPF
jgi:hypothetical protein